MNSKNEGPINFCLKELQLKLKDRFFFDEKTIRWLPVFSQETTLRTQFLLKPKDERESLAWMKIYGYKEQSENFKEVRCIIDQQQILSKSLAHDNLMLPNETFYILEKHYTFFCFIFDFWGSTSTQISFGGNFKKQFKVILFQSMLFLSVLEKERIIHYDITPSNLFIDQECCVCFSGFNWPGHLISTLLPKFLEKGDIGAFDKKLVMGFAPEVLFGDSGKQASNTFQVGMTILYLIKRSLDEKKERKNEFWLSYLINEEPIENPEKDSDIFGEIAKLVRFLGCFSPESGEFYSRLVSSSRFSPFVQKKLLKIIKNATDKKNEAASLFNKPFVRKAESQKNMGNLLRIIEKMIDLHPAKRSYLKELFQEKAIEKLGGGIASPEKNQLKAYTKLKEMENKPIGNELQEIWTNILNRKLKDKSKKKKEDNEQAKGGFNQRDMESELSYEGTPTKEDKKRENDLKSEEKFEKSQERIKEEEPKPKKKRGRKRKEETKMKIEEETLLKKRRSRNFK